VRRCGSDRIGDVTYALVSIAGPFMGFHIGCNFGTVAEPADDFLRHRVWAL